MSLTRKFLVGHEPSRLFPVVRAISLSYEFPRDCLRQSQATAAPWPHKTCGTCKGRGPFIICVRIFKVVQGLRLDFNLTVTLHLCVLMLQGHASDKSESKTPPNFCTVTCATHNNFCRTRACSDFSLWLVPSHCHMNFQGIACGIRRPRRRRGPTKLVRRSGNGCRSQVN